MFKALIVDDESMVVDSLYATLPWEELGIDEVMKAYSSREALEVAERRHMDIIITDIRMPGMDGLELMRRIRTFSEHAIFIILTGYAEFDYAKKSIEYAAADYLLKPVSDEQIIRSIRTCVSRLQELWEQRSSYQRTVMTLKEQAPVIRSNLLRELMEGRRFSGSQLDEKLELLDLPMRHSDEIFPMLIRLESDFSKYPQQDRYLLEYAIVNMAEEIMQHHFRLWTCKDVHNFLVFIVSARPDTRKEQAYELLLRHSDQLHQKTQQVLGGSISIVIGNAAPLHRGLPQIHRDAIALMRTKIGGDKGLLLELKEADASQAANYLWSLYETPTLLQQFEAGDWKGAQLKLEVIFAQMESMPGLSSEQLFEVYHTLLAACYHYAHLNERSLLGDLPTAASLPRSLEALQTLKEWAFKLCDRLLMENQLQIEQTRSPMIEKVLAYIHSHLAEDVSLQTLADHAGYHPVYLSKIFKLTMGEGLSEYLLRVRMELAEQLLLQSDLKVYEITARVGYLNTAHFIKVFKKNHGITPQEFRESGSAAD